jgi:hypothetical protein
MPPLDVSWNPYEIFKFENCFINLNNVLRKYKLYYYNNYQFNSLTYIQINIASEIIKNKIFLVDEITTIEISPFENYDDRNDKLSIKNKEIVNVYFQNLDFELNSLLEDLKQGSVSKEKEEIEEIVLKILEDITLFIKKKYHGT